MREQVEQQFIGVPSPYRYGDGPLVNETHNEGYAMDNHKCDKCDRPATTKTEIQGGPTIYGCADHPSYVQAQQQVQNSESKFVVNPEQESGT